MRTRVTKKEKIIRHQSDVNDKLVVFARRGCAVEPLSSAWEYRISHPSSKLAIEVKFDPGYDKVWRKAGNKRWSKYQSAPILLKQVWGLDYKSRDLTVEIPYQSVTARRYYIVAGRAFRTKESLTSFVRGLLGRFGICRITGIASPGTEEFIRGLANVAQAGYQDRMKEAAEIRVLLNEFGHREIVLLNESGLEIDVISWHKMINCIEPDEKQHVRDFDGNSVPIGWKEEIDHANKSSDLLMINELNRRIFKINEEISKNSKL